MAWFGSLLGSKKKDKKGKGIKKPVGGPIATPPSEKMLSGKAKPKKDKGSFGAKNAKGFNKWAADKDKRTKLGDR